MLEQKLLNFTRILQISNFSIMFKFENPKSHNFNSLSSMSWLSIDKNIDLPFSEFIIKTAFKFSTKIVQKV